MKLLKIERIYLNADAVDYFTGAGGSTEICFRGGGKICLAGYSADKIAELLKSVQ
jgi:hypothetical protein